MKNLVFTTPVERKLIAHIEQAVDIIGGKPLSLLCPCAGHWLYCAQLFVDTTIPYYPTLYIPLLQDTQHSSLGMDYNFINSLERNGRGLFF